MAKLLKTVKVVAGYEKLNSFLNVVEHNGVWLISVRKLHLQDDPTGASGAHMPHNTVKPETKLGNPIKFTSSNAYVNYTATSNFYGGGHRDLPRSHNIMLASTGILAFFYLIFIRDDIDDNEGFQGLIKPIHESVPRYAIPVVQSAIIEARKMKRSTKELEAKLAEYMKDPEKYGGIPDKKPVQEN